MDNEIRRSMPWKTIAELVGLASIVASLIFVGLQLRQSDSIARAELWSNLHANEIEVDQAFIEHAEIWSRGNAEEALNDHEDEVFRRLIKLRNDYYYYSLSSARALGLLDGGESIIIVQLASWLNEHPRAKSLWLEREANLQSDRRRLNPDLPETHPWAELVEDTMLKLAAPPTQTAPEPIADD